MDEELYVSNLAEQQAARQKLARVDRAIERIQEKLQIYVISTKRRQVIANALDYLRNYQIWLELNYKIQWAEGRAASHRIASWVTSCNKDRLIHIARVKKFTFNAPSFNASKEAWENYIWWNLTG